MPFKIIARVNDTVERKKPSLGTNLASKWCAEITVGRVLQCIVAQRGVAK